MKRTLLILAVLGLAGFFVVSSNAFLKFQVMGSKVIYEEVKPTKVNVYGFGKVCFDCPDVYEGKKVGMCALFSSAPTEIGDPEPTNIRYVAKPGERICYARHSDRDYIKRDDVVACCLTGFFAYEGTNLIKRAEGVYENAVDCCVGQPEPDIRDGKIVGMKCSEPAPRTYPFWASVCDKVLDTSKVNVKFVIYEAEESEAAGGNEDQGSGGGFEGIFSSIHNVITEIITKIQDYFIFIGPGLLVFGFLMRKRKAGKIMMIIGLAVSILGMANFKFNILNLTSEWKYLTNSTQIKKNLKDIFEVGEPIYAGAVYFSPPRSFTCGIYEVGGNKDEHGHVPYVLVTFPEKEAVYYNGKLAYWIYWCKFPEGINKPGKYMIQTCIGNEYDYDYCPTDKFQVVPINIAEITIKEKSTGTNGENNQDQGNQDQGNQSDQGGGQNQEQSNDILMAVIGIIAVIGGIVFYLRR